MSEKETLEIGKGKPGPGRPKGVPNKTTQLLKDAIVQAATDAGDGNLVAYLRNQAIESPGPFLTLLGKVLPLQITGGTQNSMIVEIRETYVDAGASARHRDERGIQTVQ